MFFHRHDILEKMDQIGNETLYFSRDLYDEHLENASFFYESRFHLLNAPHVSWLDLADVESRLRTHIEALVLGDELSVEVCHGKINTRQRGILYAAVRLFCYLGKVDEVKNIIDGLDVKNSRHITEITYALCHGLPRAWHDMIRGMMSSRDIMLIRMAADVIGYRRLSMMNELMEVIKKTQNDLPATVVRTAGRLRLSEARPYLLDIVKNKQTGEAIKYEACLALLRIGEKNLIKPLLQKDFAGNSRYLIMGLCDDFNDAPMLQEIATSAAVCDENLLALGLLGDLSSVDLLINHMLNPQLSEAASLSLNLLTGAGLLEDAFIPDPIDESSLFTYQKEKLKRGEPLYPPGEEPGVTVNRLSQNPETWKIWWIQNKIRFNNRERYRNGRLFSPSGILKTMESPKCPGTLRQLAYEDLVIRYGKDVCFDISFPVKEQIMAINEYTSWANAHEEQ